MNKRDFNHGETLYIELAEQCGVLPIKALARLDSMLLESDFDCVEDFLEALGNGDPLAMIEARSHFGLAPL